LWDVENAVLVKDRLRKIDEVSAVDVLVSLVKLGDQRQPIMVCSVAS